MIKTTLHPDLLHAIQSPHAQFDVHCHIFTFNCVPKKFLFIHLPTSLEEGGNRIERILERIISRTKKENIANIKTFFDIGLSKSLDDVAETLFSYYNQHTIFCPLMMDLEWGLGNRPHIPFFDAAGEKIDQIRLMEHLTELFPHKLMPFIAIDPQNPHINDIFDRAFGKQSKGLFGGVKIYPALGYLPSNKALMPIFEKCEALQIPVTTHCGGSIIYTTERNLKVSGIQIDQNGDLVQTEIKKRRINRAAGNKISKLLNSPQNWEPVLKTFPQLKLNLAHFGGKAVWQDYVKTGKNNTINDIISFMERYEYVYSDFSFNIFEPKFYEPYKQLLEQNDLVKSRSLFGSDFYMASIICDVKKAKNSFLHHMGKELSYELTTVNPKKFLFGI